MHTAHSIVNTTRREHKKLFSLTHTHAHTNIELMTRVIAWKIQIFYFATKIFQTHNFKRKREIQTFFHRTFAIIFFLPLSLLWTVQTELKQKVNYESKVSIDSIKRINLCVLYVRHINIYAHTNKHRAQLLMEVRGKCAMLIFMCVFRSTRVISCFIRRIWYSLRWHHVASSMRDGKTQKSSDSCGFADIFIKRLKLFAPNEIITNVLTIQTRIFRVRVCGNCIRCLNVCICV